MVINLADNSPRVDYAATTPQTVFAIPFEFFENDEVVAYVDGVLQTLDVNYSISGGDGATGTLTLTVAAENENVILYRRIPLERQTDFQTGNDINRAL